VRGERSKSSQESHDIVTAMVFFLKAENSNSVCQSLPGASVFQEVCVMLKNWDSVQST
jgi:hypothetical protein